MSPPTALWRAVPSVLDPDPGTARRWLERELSRPEYRESVLQRLQRWLGELLDLVAGTGGGLGGVAAVVVGVGLVAVAVLVLARVRRSAAAPRESAEVFEDRRLGSEDHRRAARAARSAGRHEEALLEAVRALSAGLSERGLLPERAGVTVAETTGAAAERFPGLARELGAVAQDFDRTRYGERGTTRAAADAALALEEQVRRSSPARDAVGGPRRPAVPR
ncbi:protein of unknown function [Nocardioides scoriae]|uniref:Protein-glutamine gamma-glutamyltransferase-like C-terminal domain-containing protein n=1 Tax=Nocardioides scoriae TaxID=642780 RepID=A0A1H1TB97_9ACTN|nr:DUF4129 domain-containing protein [Nocardioides scoriae]SDS57331.1 protein of unknown function [Nocardioides scoriae]